MSEDDVRAIAAYSQRIRKWRVQSCAGDAQLLPVSAYDTIERLADDIDKLLQERARLVEALRDALAARGE